ncbi:MAG: RpoL/Rpb11 RNA polymerase subunit family protein [Promethearchaeia archaeon]
MAKKKKSETDEEIDDLDELEDEEIDIAIPKVGEEDIGELEGEEALEEGELLEGDMDLTLEEEPEEEQYKYLKLNLIEKLEKNTYELQVIGQSHGFCNIYVKTLLKNEGVDIAAYKATKIEPAKIFLRIKDGYEINEILYKGITALRENVNEVKELFQTLV